MTQTPYPSPEMPAQSTREQHRQAVQMLKSLYGLGGSAKKQKIEDYLNWLEAKVVLYERDTTKWSQITSGAAAIAIDDYFKQQRMENQRALHEGNAKAAELNDIAQELQAEITELRNEITSTGEYITIIDSGLYEYDHPAQYSERFRHELARVKQQIKDMVANKTATVSGMASGFTFNNSAAQGAKFVADFSKLMLSTYNQECENVLVKVQKTRSADTASERINKAASRVEKLGSMMQIRISPAYHQLRLKEIEIAFKYREAEEQRKAEEAEQKARLREEEQIIKEAAKKAKELADAEKKARDELKALLEYQRQHYSNVVNALPREDPEIARLRAKVAELEEAKKKADNTLLNTRAGYVYIISNIGAFGEGVVKIGMTRRLNPVDRVKELSSAAVPFIFDTHAIHFSDNAVELENKLHRHFADRAVNKVNKRKEFFRVSLDEVRRALVQFSKNGSTLEFNDSADALEYHQTLALEAGTS